MNVNITYTTLLILNKIKDNSEYKDSIIHEVLWELKEKYNLNEVNYKNVFLILHYLERQKFLIINYLKGKIYLTEKGEKLLNQIIYENKKVKVPEHQLTIFPYDILLYFALIRVRNRLSCYCGDKINKYIPDYILEIIAKQKILSYEELNYSLPEVANRLPQKAWKNFFDVVRLYYGKNTPESISVN